MPEFLMACLAVALFFGAMVFVLLSSFNKKAEGRFPKVLAEYAPGPRGNNEYLAYVRSSSCYPILRGAHACISGLAALATVGTWIAASTSDNAVPATLICGAVLVGLAIEYGLFRVIVDAVDVLIDTSRRSADDKSSG